MPVEEVRAQFEAIVKGSAWWDGRMCTLHVTDLTERVMEMRCAVSAADSSRTFELCCEVREKMVVWVEQNYPAAFPTMRFSAVRRERMEDGRRVQEDGLLQMGRLDVPVQQQRGADRDERA